MDVDTRLLRSFAAVAEEGNLTRAAGRLFVSQPALTKQIRQLETLLGARLFTRSRTGMALTEAGRALAARVPALLEAWDLASREARSAAAAAARVLRVGYLASAANEATPDIVAAFARTGCPGRDGWRVSELFGGPRWVGLPSAPPLAGRDVIAFRELWDEPFVAAPAETGRWRDFWLAADEREGHPVRVGAVTDQPDDW